MFVILFYIIILLVIIGGVSIFFAKSSTLVQRFTAFVAGLALLVSLISAFKSEIFPFALKILVGNIKLTHIFDAPDEQVGIILPISFINDGYAEGIIETLTLKVKDEKGNLRVYQPLFEIDYIALIRDIKEFDPAIISGEFMQFPIHSKESILKHVFFSQKIDEKHPLLQWKPGKYVFSLYIKSSQRKREQKAQEFILNIRKEDLERFSEGKTCCIPQKRD